MHAVKFVASHVIAALHVVDSEEVGHDLSAPKTNYAKLVLLKRFIHRSQFNSVKYHCSDYRIRT